MSGPIDNPYSQIGVFLPWASTETQWAVNEKVYDYGFMLVKIIKYGIYIVQSLYDGQLYVNKLVQRGSGEMHNGGDFHNEGHPPDIRNSTWPRNRRAGVSQAGYLGHERHFVHLDIWQQLDDDTYSMYFQHCNGGDLGSVIDQHAYHGVRIPEHFIWHVAAELGEALAYMYFGRRKGVHGARGNRPNWTRIYHRDIAPNNVMVHYPDSKTRVSKWKGRLTDAFPQIVLIDFGDSTQEGDDIATIRNGIWAARDELEVPTPYEDVYPYSQVLRKLCMAHVSRDAYNEHDQPENLRLAAVNGMGDGTPYSDLLINTLQRFEYANQENDWVDFSQELRDGVPSIDWVCDTLVPLARREVARWKLMNPETPGETLAESLDMSWTKPKVLMPFTCDHRTNEGIDNFNSLASLAVWEHLRPKHELRRAEIGAVTELNAWGPTAATAILGTPVEAMDSFDYRKLNVSSRPRRDFERKATELIYVLQGLSAHEAQRLNGDDPPSDDDEGPDHGRRFEDPPLNYDPRRNTEKHRLLRHFNMAVAKLGKAASDYDRKRQNIRAMARGQHNQLPDDKRDDPVNALDSTDDGHSIAEIVDALYPDEDPPKDDPFDDPRETWPYVPMEGDDGDDDGGDDGGDDGEDDGGGHGGGHGGHGEGDASNDTMDVDQDDG
ncbi:hypothetical protein JX265_008518 [Neoarthrinium moseri]|uniref:EKC/KEOPS complex subunit BUD32 n=1 Tax=Neoarthrinium moseri TaxID=1658444 RepID=A0A9P9WIC7_9PEZI|nr:hypothetical protein JX265_008518 [Neoarthrinium moseri]